MLLEAGVRVAGINRGRHTRFAKELDLPYPLLSDRGGRVAKAYGARGLLLNRRTVVGIDARGVVRLHRRGAPSASEILDAIP